ncbi:MAG TPA: NAD-dependent epimerase/dehydratase family protein [Candidatus Kapabacteria bacterium]|jgi:nucleoside-diphosphate-sugar epimerase|nr:NAD-dependent epimerase/dehydratase family protein [Candidatus Kapabacteria bacterium]
MKALITGATGFIGSHLAEHLHEKGYELRALIRPSSDTKWLKHLPVEYVTGSFSDIASLVPAVRDVDVIYHVAGVVAARDRKGFFDGNQLATANLMDAVIEANPSLARFVHVSSQAACGPSPSADRPVDESMPMRPITTYGESKAAAEREVIERMSVIPSTIVRPPAVYGPRDVGVYTFFQVVGRGLAPLIGFDRKLVSLIHARDLVRGFVMAGEASVAEGETYFISSERFYDWKEVGEITARVMGRRRPRYLNVPHPIIFGVAAVNGFMGRFMKKPPILDFEKGRDLTQGFWTCSVEKASRDLGFEESLTIEAGIEDTVGWYRHHGWL